MIPLVVRASRSLAARAKPTQLSTVFCRSFSVTFHEKEQGEEIRFMHKEEQKHIHDAHHKLEQILSKPTTKEQMQMRLMLNNYVGEFKCPSLDSL